MLETVCRPSPLAWALALVAAVASTGCATTPTTESGWVRVSSAYDKVPTKGKTAWVRFQNPPSVAGFDVTKDLQELLTRDGYYNLVADPNDADVCIDAILRYFGSTPELKDGQTLDGLAGDIAGGLQGWTYPGGEDRTPSTKTGALPGSQSDVLAPNKSWTLVMDFVVGIREEPPSTGEVSAEVTAVAAAAGRGPVFRYERRLILPTAGFFMTRKAAVEDISERLRKESLPGVVPR